MIDAELWRPVPSAPGLEASSLGRVRVVPWQSPMPHGGMRTYGGYEGTGQWDESTQRFIFPFRGKSFKVAPLVCEAFHGGKPFPKAVCCHKDENSKNNRADNLDWGTQKQNLNYPGFLKYCKARTGDKNPYVKGRRERAESSAATECSPEANDSQA